MPRAVIPGATDYSHQSFVDMVDDLKAWVASLRRTCEALENSERHLQQSGYWERVDLDVKSILGYALILFRTSVDEITEILAEILVEVEDHHIARLMTLAQTATRLDRDLGQVWHADAWELRKWELRKEPGEPDFEVVARMYASARDMAVDMIDLSNLVSRLKDFSGRKPSDDRKAQPAGGRLTILLMTADPTDDNSRLRLGEELREIQEKLQLARLRDRFELQPRMSVRPADISQALLDVQPQIVHFSGHGAATGELSFEDQCGDTHPIAPDALAALFEQFAGQVECVVLNACYSEVQANAIAEHIDYVVGMNQAIGDKAAIAFAIGFYQALGAGRTIEEAYKLGCVQIRLQGVPEHLTPVLVKKGQAKPLPQEASKPQSSTESRQLPSGVAVSLVFNKDGLVIKDEQELKACLAEALFAAENQLPVTFDMILEPLEVVERYINSIESGEASPENRITEVNLLKQARTLEANKRAMTAALPMLVLPPIRPAFLSVDELIESIQGLARQLFESDYSVNADALDVFRTTDPKLNTVIWLDGAEVERVKSATGLKSISALVGSGWDLFDLPREVRFRKAIPAIILEIIRRSKDADEPIDVLKALDLHKWSIGLH